MILTQGDYLILKNEFLEVWTIPLGCAIVKLLVKDKNGDVQDVVLGYDTEEEYASQDAYLGVVVGRVANRIGKGQYTINGKTYHVPINNGPNSLHGGIKGFSFRKFNYTIANDTIDYSYISPDKEEGFNGNVEFHVIYSLEGNTFKMQYKAISDEDTVLNITNHSYFNLSGAPSDVTDHILTVHASKFAHVDEDGLVDGVIEDVEGTPFDFREPKRVADQIAHETENEQLRIGKGFDHPFIFDTKENQVQLYNETTGIEMNVSTSYPLATIYTANYLVNLLGKDKHAMTKRSGICVETQFMSNDINLNENSKTILKKGEEYNEYTSFTFRTK